MKVFNTEEILGYPVVSDSLETCINVIEGWLGAVGSPRTFVCANPHSLITALGTPQFSKVFFDSDLVTPDGVGIVFASKIMGGAIRHRITGSDVFHGVCKVLNNKEGGSCFFLGSTEQTLESIRARMQVDYPNVRVATYSPPFRDVFSSEENRLMIESINTFRPDVLWVGMTAPKQENWISRHKDQLDVKFVGAIGAVFDFYSGKVQRSHPMFQRMGLEWLPRLIREPKRLWRRNLISTPNFVVRVLKGWLKN